MSGTAVFGNNGMYRYWLERPLAEEGITVAFIGVNPSDATEFVPDQTDMKWRGFGRLMGARRYVAGNPFAFRSKDVKALASAHDPVGPLNDNFLYRIIDEADVIVPCWGSRNKLPKTLWPRLDSVREMMLDSRKPLKVFGFTASGDPKHPLMLGYKTQLVDWVR